MTRKFSGLKKMCGGDNHNVHDTHQLLDYGQVCHRERCPLLLVHSMATPGPKPAYVKGRQFQPGKGLGHGRRHN